MRTGIQVLREVLDVAMAPREKLSTAEWADKYREILVGARKGRWSTDRTPYLRGVMDAIDDPFVREITLMSARQVGKTEVLINAAGRTIDLYPQDMQWIYPTEEIARFNNKARFMPTLRRMSRTKRWFGKSNRDAGAMEMHFRRMVIRFAGSNSEAALESYPYGMVFLDELDRCAPGTMDQVRESMKTYTESKFVKVSTPSFAGVGIDAEYNGTQVSGDDDEGGDGFIGTPPSDRRRFAVPCPTCGAFHVRTFSMVKWEGGKSASPAVVRRGAWMACPCCDAKIVAADNIWQLQRGVWAPVARGEGRRASGGGGGKDAAGKAAGGAVGSSTVIAPRRLVWPGQERGVKGSEVPVEALEGGGFDIPAEELRWGEHVGFHLSGLCSSLGRGNPYGEVAAKFVQGGCVMTRSFCNRVLGEAWVLKGEAIDVKTIAARAGGYDIGQVVEDALVITVGCDVQQDRIFAEVLAWGEGGRVCWFIEGHEIPRTRGANLVELDPLAKKVWTRSDGKRMRVAVVAVDSGKYTDEVYRWVGKWPAVCAVGEGPRKVWAVKGEQGAKSTHPWRESVVTAREDRAASAVGEGMRLLLVNTGYWKEHILARLGGTTAPAAAEGVEAVVDEWKFPRAVSRGYLMQLTAEQRVTERRGAQFVTSWVLRPGRTANHFLDCRVYGCAAADKEGVGRLVRPAAGAGGASGVGVGSGTRGGDASGGAAGRGSTFAARARERRGLR